MIPLVGVPLGMLVVLVLVGGGWHAGRLRAGDGLSIAAGLVLIIGAAFVAVQQGVAAADKNGSEGSLLPLLLCAVVGAALVTFRLTAQRRRARGQLVLRDSCQQIAPADFLAGA